MQIHKKRRPALVAAVQRAFATIYVDHAIYIDDDTLGGFDDAEREVSADELKALKNCVGERPLHAFASGFLSERLEGREFAKDDRETLTDALGDSSFSALAEEMVAALESLPFEYLCSFALSDQIDASLDDGGPWGIAPNISVAKGDAFDLAHPNYSADRPDQDRFLLQIARLLDEHLPKAGTAHLTVHVKGHLQRYAAYAPTQEAADQAIRTFFGLALVFNVVSYSPAFGQQTEVRVHVHRPRSGPAEPFIQFRLSTSTSRVLRGLRFVEQIKEPGHRAWPKTPQMVWVQWVLSHDKGERLHRAARWFFDSFGSDSVLMQYLQAMICMEILLGDAQTKDGDISVGALIRNRCAYLIGKDVDEREEISANIKRIYATRSAIVHNGLSEMSSDDRKLLATLRWYCARVIEMEASRLGAVASLRASPDLNSVGKGVPSGHD